MKRIEFKKIAMSYFISTGEEVVYDFEEGINFIVGENKTTVQADQKNGCGKTVIFLDSILFALYGQVSRQDFSKNDIIFNKGGKKKCFVSLDILITEGDKKTKVNIHRTLNPSKLILTVDGKDISQSHSKSTQEYIVSHILGGVKYDVFKQSIAMDITKTGSLLTMSKVEREKFIGGIFDLEYIKEAEKLVRDDYNQLNKDTEVLNKSVAYISGLITSNEQRIKDYESSIVDEVAQIKKNIESLEAMYEELVIPEEPAKIDVSAEKEKLEEHARVAKKKKDEILTKITTIRSKIQSITYSIRDMERSNESLLKSKSCPTCKRDFDESTKEDIDNTIEENNNTITVNRAGIERLEEGVKKLEQQLEEVHKVEEQIKKSNDSLMARLVSYQDELEKVTNAKNKQTAIESKIASEKVLLDSKNNSEVVTELRDTLETHKAEYDKNKKEFDENIKDLEKLTHLKVMFGEGGIREVILSRIIKLFNVTINSYLERLEAPCIIEFDSTFNYKLTTLGGVDIPYGGLSGGERVRVTTALAFTFKDILRIQNQISFSLSIYDEWFDVSIDPRGLEIMASILEERLEKYKESSNIITHRVELTCEKSKTIKVVKENGISRIESIKQNEQ